MVYLGDFVRTREEPGYLFSAEFLSPDHFIRGILRSLP